MEENKMTNVLIKTLKQHTPLLHFSPLEPGATLRASEVKPKLDRYLIKKLGGGDYDSVKQQVRTNNPDWFVKKEGVYALNYQLKIIAENKDKTTINIRKGKDKYKKNEKTGEEEKYFNLKHFPLVLGNMGGKLDKEKLANFSFYEYIRLVFIIPAEVKEQYEFKDDNHKEEYLKNLSGLYKVIEENIAEFFSLTNFGQRSGKGFGSFSVVNDNGVVTVPARVPYFKYSFNGIIDYDSMKTLFTAIDYYWKFLKSGVNYTKREIENGKIVRLPESDEDREALYNKAFLYEYLNDDRNDLGGITWEKRKVKTDLYLESEQASNDDWKVQENPNRSFFARAHLGAPGDTMQYRVATGVIITDKDGEIKEDFKNEKLSITNNYSQELSRIPSPIVFKPVIDGLNIKVYMLINMEVVKAIQFLPDDTTFTFTKESTGERSIVNLFVEVKDGNKFIFNYAALLAAYHKYMKNNLPVIDSNGNVIVNLELS